MPQGDDGQDSSFARPVLSWPLPDGSINPRLARSRKASEDLAHSCTSVACCLVTFFSPPQKKAQKNLGDPSRGSLRCSWSTLAAVSLISSYGVPVGLIHKAICVYAYGVYTIHCIYKWLTSLGSVALYHSPGTMWRSGFFALFWMYGVLLLDRGRRIIHYTTQGERQRSGDIG